MNGHSILCPDCGGGMKYGGFKVSGTSVIRTGYGCNYCGTVTERFGTIDSTSAVNQDAAA